MKDEVLCIIDMQVDFITGTLKNESAEAIIPKIVKRIEEFDGCLIIATRDTHKINYLNTLEGEKLPTEHCLENTPGHCIVPEISKALIKAEKCGIKVVYVDKETFGAPTLPSIALNIAPIPISDLISRFVLVGTCTGICVLSNAVILKTGFPNTPICVVEDECACITLESHKTAIEAMKLLQVDII